MRAYLKVGQPRPPSTSARGTMSNTKPTLTTLPPDLLVDCLLPLLPPASLAALSQTSRDWHDLIEGPNAEAVWRRKAVQDFHFPVASTGRRRGWRELYRRLLKQSCYVWGVRRGVRMTRQVRL